MFVTVVLSEDPKVPPLKYCHSHGNSLVPTSSVTRPIVLGHCFDFVLNPAFQSYQFNWRSLKSTYFLSIPREKKITCRARKTRQSLQILKSSGRQTSLREVKILTMELRQETLPYYIDTVVTVVPFSSSKK